MLELLVVRVQSDNFNTADVSEMSLDRVLGCICKLFNAITLDDDNLYVDESLADDDKLTKLTWMESGPS